MQENNDNNEFASLIDQVDNLLKGEKTQEKAGEYGRINSRMFQLMPNTDAGLIARASLVCDFGISIQQIYDTARMEADQAVGKNSIHYKPMIMTAVIKKCSDIAGVWLQKEICGSRHHQNFISPLHEAMYNHYFYDSENNIKTKGLMFPISELLFHIGLSLNEFHEFDKAIGPLTQACAFNITSTACNYELAESYKCLRRYTEFVNASKMAWRFATRPNEIARFFRNMAFYYSEINQWKNAYLNVKISQQYESDSERARQEIDYIIKNANVGIQRDITEKMLTEYAEKTGNPTTANPVAMEYLSMMSGGKKE